MVAVVLVLVVVVILIITNNYNNTQSWKKKICIAFYEFCISFNYIFMCYVALEICEMTRGDYLARKLYGHFV